MSNKWNTPPPYPEDRCLALVKLKSNGFIPSSLQNSWYNIEQKEVRQWDLFLSFNPIQLVTIELLTFTPPIRGGFFNTLSNFMCHFKPFWFT